MDEELDLKFVKPANAGDIPQALTEAANLLAEYELKFEWMEQEQCLSVGEEDKLTYIVDPFQGPGFEHLKKMGCRVFGPQCILASLRFKMELPQMKRPIYSVCMKGVTISCTSMEKNVRDRLHELVELMGGQTVRNLTDHVTHLVAGEVGSQKYTVAASRGIPVMLTSWVTNAWDIAQHRYVDCTEAAFVHEHRCPIFKGLVITVSGLNHDERLKIKNLVESEGGLYTGELKKNECTHLILKEPKGQKYSYASKWSVHTVSMAWVFDSLDKNFCQDESNYPVTLNSAPSASIKTSTPEKSRRSAINPSISDLSAISATHIDETALTRTGLSDVTMEPSEVSPAVIPLLSHCKLFISKGITDAQREHCSKLLNAAGVTRSKRMNSSVSHVIMEERVDAEINLLAELELRPHVVTLEWLAECVKQSRVVSEAPYLSPHVMVSTVELTTVNQPPSNKSGTSRKSQSMDGVKNSGGGQTSSSSSSSGRQQQPSVGDDKHLLSQYTHHDLMENDRTVTSVDEVDGNTTTTSTTSASASDGPAASNRHSSSTHRQQLQQEEEQEEDATQDPDDEGTTLTEGGVFGGRTFAFYGFSPEDQQALVDYVLQAGGKCVEAGRRGTDYGVVPILGHPVDHNVGQVVTNAWLQMCLEAEALLAVRDNPIFQPLSMDETQRPLHGCVLSISGYSGTERDCLNHIANVLGAECQEYFVRKAKRALKASTHLITREASGPKYQAARKWSIPAVSKQWLLACAKSGKREDEESFDIDTVTADTTHTTTDPGPTSGHTQAEKQSPRHKTSAEGPTAQAARASTSDGVNEDRRRSVKPMDVETGQDSGARAMTTSDLPGDGSEQRRQTAPAEERRKGGRAGKDLVPSSMSQEEEEEEETKTRDGQLQHDDLSNPMGSAKALQAQTTEGSPSEKENNSAKALQQETGEGGPSQKENMAAKTPVMKALDTGRPQSVGTCSRVKELQQNSRYSSPGLESPSVFLAPGWRPTFDLTGVYEYLKTPEGQKKNRRESMSLQECFEMNLKKACEQLENQRNASPSVGFSPQTQSSQVDDRGVLEGVVIAVSKKLGLHQTEYNTIVVELGGDYTWQYAPSCTHYIFQGRSNDLNKEYRQAKTQGKFIVSPYWLYACQEQRCRVDEAMFPHNYNPNLNLGGVVRTETPARSLRSSARATPSRRPGSKTPASKRPANKTPAPDTKAPGSCADPLGPPSSSRSGVSDLDSSTHSTPRTRRSAAAPANEIWKASMNEMHKWQEGEAAAKTSDSKCADPDHTTDQTDHSLQNPANTTAHTTDQSDTENKGQASLTSPTEKTDEGSRVKTMSSSSNDEKSDDKSNDREAEQDQPQDMQAEPVAGGSSLDVREALCKTLETVRASTRSKQSSRKKRRRGDRSSASGGQTSRLTELATSTHHASPWHTQHLAAEGLEGTEASQSLQITWDDPTGRKEKERLAHKLEMLCGPSQDTEDFMAHMDMPDMELSAQEEDKAPTEPAKVRSPTPEAPPLAFPTARMVSRVKSPQPIELLEEEDSSSHAAQAPKPIILTSGMAPRERIEFAEVIERLGGTVLEKQQFDTTCTHLVVEKPSRNEKFLAAVASGRWVLHKSYLIACCREQRFVPEEDHEWGSPSMAQLLQTMDSQTHSLVSAAHRWRVRVQQQKKRERGCEGAYQGWRVILLTEKKREDNFRRLLTAGGATVLNLRPPFTEVDATHCFVEMLKVKLSESDQVALVSGVTHMLKPEFIAAHLTDDPSPDPVTFTPAEVKRLRERLQEEEQRKKRKRGGKETESSKRPRR